MSEQFIEDPGIDVVESATLRDFFGMWLDPKTSTGMPRAKDFSLTDFAPHLPFMIQNDFDAATGRFSVRFVGSSYAKGVGADYTNRFVDEIPDTEDLLVRSRWLVENKKPYLVLNTRIIWSPKDFKYADSIACPLFDEKGSVSGLLFRIEFS